MVSNNVLSYNRLRSVVLNLAFTLKNYCKVHSVKNCGIFLMLYSFSIQQCLAQLSVLEVDIYVFVNHVGASKSKLENMF